MKAFYRLFYYISIVLTSILAGVTIAGAFVGNAAPDSFKFMPFIGLILPILLLANLASVIYWTIRWRCWVFIPLIAIFSNWSYISCVIHSPFSARLRLQWSNERVYSWYSNCCYLQR